MGNCCNTHVYTCDCSPQRPQANSFRVKMISSFPDIGQIKDDDLFLVEITDANGDKILTSCKFKLIKDTIFAYTKANLGNTGNLPDWFKVSEASIKTDLVNDDIFYLETVDQLNQKVLRKVKFETLSKTLEDKIKALVATDIDNKINTLKQEINTTIKSSIVNEAVNQINTSLPTSIRTVLSTSPLLDNMPKYKLIITDTDFNRFVNSDPIKPGTTYYITEQVWNNGGQYALLKTVPMKPDPFTFYVIIERLTTMGNPNLIDIQGYTMKWFDRMGTSTPSPSINMGHICRIRFDCFPGINLQPPFVLATTPY